LISSPEARDLRAAILIAAGRLFIEKGYRGLSMRQIAEAVGVSKAALYYHFQDKEALFLSLLDTYLDEIEALIERVCEQEATACGRVRALVKAILDQAVEQRALIRLGVQEVPQLKTARREAFSQAYRQKFILPIQAILESGIKTGELRPIDAHVAVWALLGMMYPYFYPAHLQEIPPASQVAEQIVTIYLDGIAYGNRTPTA
jgi:TetR/AcrR family transcriptional regulator, cholesterol catabolism regulator